MATALLSLKLLVDTKANKVLFAEAGKGFVDFLFHILSLPLATVVKLLKDEGMAGSLLPLYQSVESLSTNYFEQGRDRNSILMPKIALSLPLLSLHEFPSTVKLCICAKQHAYAGDFYGGCCRNTSCIQTMNEVRYTYVPPPSSGTSVNGIPGYVKAVVPYMVMDNLEVKPMSLTLIKSHVNYFDLLEEQEVQVGPMEGLAILKASLQTKDVLTTVFLRKKA